MGGIPAVKTFPVIETFGPTCQGEGPNAGQRTMFVRFGGCDYRCSWCDSLYAVLPDQVKANSVLLTAEEIIDRLGPPTPTWTWVTLSGGNPAMLKLGTLVERLKEIGYRVAVETQGSLWKDWLADVDSLVISPKPPSSGMWTVGNAQENADFMERIPMTYNTGAAIKIVVFDDEDFHWAVKYLNRYPSLPAFLSAGTDPPSEHEPLTETRELILDRYRWLCERTLEEGVSASVLPQLHVLAWGHARGV